ncbi:MAG: site-2 protease family protein, partial [Actinomycetota bacterium]
MGGTFRVGRVAGVEVRVHWSVLVIFVLIATGLSVGSFPQAYPGYSGAAYALAGLVAAVAFLGGLLAHEVSHAVVARRNGIEVEDITLWLFGGVAQLHGDPRDPGAELRVAGVGPLVSLLLGLGTGAIAVGLAAAGVS